MIRLAVAAAVAVTSLSACGGERAAAPTERDWLRGRVQLYQEIGLLPDRSTDVLARQIQRRYAAEEWVDANGRVDATLDRRDPQADMQLLHYGGAPIWWEDLEMDVLPGNDVYVETLRELARLSGGDFAPRRLREQWESEEGPVRVSFVHRGRRFALRPAYLEDYLDPGILCDVNEIMNGERPFWSADTGDQTAFFVRLTRPQARRLHEAGWRFLDCSGTARIVP